MSTLKEEERAKKNIKIYFQRLLNFRFENFSFDLDKLMIDGFLWFFFKPFIHKIFLQSHPHQLKDWYRGGFVVGEKGNKKEKKNHLRWAADEREETFKIILTFNLLIIFRNRKNLIQFASIYNHHR